MSRKLTASVSSAASRPETPSAPTRAEVLALGPAVILPEVAARYGLDGYAFEPVSGHAGGRNLVYFADRRDAPSYVVRISFLGDRDQHALQGEADFIRHVHTHGAPVAAVLPSLAGNLVETVVHAGTMLFVSVFDRARGKTLAEHGYRYRPGAPISEYFRSRGAALGKLHRAAKTYEPVPHASTTTATMREFFSAERLDALLPANRPRLRARAQELAQRLDTLAQTPGTFGMVHFDFTGGNHVIDYETGEITIFDFDSSCLGWYLYDIADLWRSGTGWVQFEPDPDRRRAFMDDYFATSLAGYRAETSLSDDDLALLPFFIDLNVLEGIVDICSHIALGDWDPDDDGELAYLIACLEGDIPYVGFFDEMYSTESPFVRETSSDA